MNELTMMVSILPKDAKQEIAKKTSVSYSEVTRMFRGLETKDTPKVIAATKELLRERGIILDPSKFGENALQKA